MTATPPPAGQHAVAPAWTHRTADWFAGLTGLRRLGMAFLAGALSAVAMPPLYAFPALFVGLIVFVWIADGTLAARKPRRSAFWTGWFFGWGYFIVGLWWVANAMLVNADRWWWMIPFAIAGLPALLAVFWGIALTFWRFWARRGRARIPALAVALALAEWLRGHVLTGFPWNLPGQTWGPFDSLLQSNAWIGAYGLTALTLLAAVSLAVFVPSRAERMAGAAATGRWWLFPAAMVVVFALMAVGGHIRLGGAPAIDPDADGLRVRLVQPNIGQAEKWEDVRRIPNVYDQIAQSQGDGLDDIDLVIWSETAVTFPVDLDPDWLAQLAAAAPPGGHLLTGVLRAEPATAPADQDDAAQSVPNANATPPPPRLYNSMLVVDDQGQAVAHYDKSHLVPFGEYMPGGELLSFMLVTGGGFTPGPGIQTLALDGVPAFSPLICYEVIFPGAVTSGDGPRPEWLLNITNDAWYGDSPGPRQHFQIARLRTIEEGMPLVRVANTGISGAVDAYGRVIDTVPLVTSGVLDVTVPPPLPDGTLYTLWGDLPFLLLCVAVLAAGLFVRPVLTAATGSVS